MTKFKVVKHGWGYHVIGFEGTKKPKKGEPTYREQCISSHYTLGRAEASKLKYLKAKLELSKYAKPDTLVQKVIKETPLALGLAVACAVAAEIYIKLSQYLIALGG